MTWHYRVLQHPEGHLALHEVYCDEKGQPNGYTENPISFVADEEEGIDGIARSLQMALNDTLNRPVLNVASFPETAVSTTISLKSET